VETLVQTNVLDHNLVAIPNMVLPTVHFGNVCFDCFALLHDSGRNRCRKEHIVDFVQFSTSTGTNRQVRVVDLEFYTN